MIKRIITYCALALLTFFNSGNATPPQGPLPLHLTSEVIGFDRASNILDLQISLSIASDTLFTPCRSFRTEVAHTKHLSVLSEVDWTSDFSSETQFTRRISLQLSPGDTSQIVLEFVCLDGGSGSTFSRHFVISDSLEIWPMYPADMLQNRHKNDPKEVDWDTLSATELAKEYEIRILLRKEVDREKAKAYFGYLPELDSAYFTTMTISLKEIIYLGRELNLELGIVNPAAWMPEVDSPNHPNKKKR